MTAQGRARAGGEDQPPASLHDHPARYVKLPVAVARRSDLSCGARTLYGILLSFAWNGAECTPAQERLAADLGCTVRTVHRYTRELVGAGLVAVQRRGQAHTNCYLLGGVQQGHSMPDDRTRASTSDRTKASDQRVDDRTRASTSDRTKASDPLGSIDVSLQTTTLGSPSGDHRRAEAPPPPPSHPAIDAIVSTWLGCNAQSAEKAHAATLARYRQWAAEALGRGYSADELVGCLVYTAGRRDAAGKSYTITDVILADRLEPWIAAGRPERYEAPPPVQQASGPRRADLPAPLIPCEPYHAVICRCGRIQGRPHRRNICRMSGLVAANNYRDMHNPNWITTPEGEFEEYDESEQEQSAAASG
jgi:hypothetical protein